MAIKKTEAFGDRLVQLIKNRGYSKSDTARMAESSPANITWYCSGKRHPSREALLKLCESLNCSPAWLERGIGSINDKFNKDRYLVDDYTSIYIDRDSSFDFRRMSEGRLMMNIVLSRKTTKELEKIFLENA